MHDYERLLARLPGAKVIELPYNRTTTPETVIADHAADREGELRAIARQIKQHLTNNPSLRPSDCAITLRQVSPYLGIARQVFQEYDLPFDPPLPANGSAPDSWACGSAAYSACRRMVSACATSPPCFPVDSSTSAAGSFPVTSSPSSPDGEEMPIRELAGMP